MPKRFCTCTGCPACNGQSHLFPAGQGPRCPPCERHHDRARGTRQQRGYNSAHDQLREQLLSQWVPGQSCALCKTRQWDKSKLDLAHTPDRKGWAGLACWPCNRGHTQ